MVWYYVRRPSLEGIRRSWNPDDSPCFMALEYIFGCAKGGS